MPLEFAHTVDQNHSKAGGTFADVILPFPLNKAFTYRLQDEQISSAGIGKRAVVQFGKSKIYSSIIVKIHKNEPELYKAKDVINILDDQPIVTQQQIDLWYWIAEYYCCAIGEVMAAALPSTLKLESESKIALNPGFDKSSELTDDEFLITEALELQHELTISIIQDILNKKSVFDLIKSLYLKGVILPKEDLVNTYKARKETILFLNETYNDQASLKELFSLLEKAPRQLDVLLAFNMLSRDAPGVLRKDLLKNHACSIASIDSLIKKEVFIGAEINVDRIGFENLPKQNFELKDFQLTALKGIKDHLSVKNCALLFGVPNSGKTHIYIKLIDEYIVKGQQVLYLVPEISLTTQLISKLRSYFGDHIGVYHSKYNSQEKYEIWHKTLNKEYSVILGVRSAVFLPFKDLGLIIIDEEHEQTFKQQDPAPRLHARDTAIYLSQAFNAKVLLGTATPSFETYYNALSGKYGLIKVTQRYSEVHPPEIVITDMKEEYLKRKNKGILSSELFNVMVSAFDENKQIILFKNRRGFSPYIECQTCGWVPKCKNCDISVTYHKHSNNLKCHYCGSKYPMPVSCPNCASTQIKTKGFGTEKVEDDVQLIFPEKAIIRMDHDTTRSKKAFEKMIHSFERGEADILVGTQMVTKGLDFEKVKIVGILNADQMLNYPDFRATERSFQLMSQVGGRAGRREDRGMVIIQTFQPQHPIFSFLIQNDFEGFYDKELFERKQFSYPPYTKLIMLTIKNKDLEKLTAQTNLLARKLTLHFAHRVLGPEFHYIARIRNEFIIQIILKFERDFSLIARSKKILVDEISKFTINPSNKNTRVIVDVDPF
jgi:primosomal protein N' (replication factor Y) (superfamily II helicase)